MIKFPVYKVLANSRSKKIFMPTFLFLHLMPVLQIHEEKKACLVVT